MNEIAEKGQQLKSEFLNAVDADTDAFNKIIEARRLPKDTGKDQARREAAILAASKDATIVPLNVMRKSLEAIVLAELMVEKGNPNSLSDAAVAGLMAKACAEGAYFNVLTNLQGLADDKFCIATKNEATNIYEEISDRAAVLSTTVLSRLDI
jgi:glutamate formiminotransferase/formiminotetrahydrofolate cyclodeaminase